MKFEIQSGDFAKAIGKLQGVLKGKTTDPKLAAIAIEAHAIGDAVPLRLSASNYEMTIVVTKTVKVLEPGCRYLNGRALFDAIRALPSDVPVSFAEGTTGGHTVEIKAKRTTYKLSYMGSVEEGFNTAVDSINRVDIDPKVLAELIDVTQHAAGRDRSRPAMTGIFFEYADGELRMTATDGHRLMTCGRPVPAWIPGFKDCVVPIDAIDEIRNLLVGDKAQIGFDDRQVAVWIGETVMTSNLHADPFPTYRQIMPEESDRIAELKKADLVDAFNHLAVLFKEKVPTVALTFGPNVLSMVTHNQELGQGNDEIDIVYAGKELKIGVNPKYLIDSVNAIPSDTIAFHLPDSPLSPIELRVNGSRAQQGIVMPMRI